MIDYQRIAEDIRAAIGTDDPDVQRLLAESAADYSAAVDEVNLRLRGCADLLKKGLRSEALQLCERSPNLLDVVAALDLPELPEWCERLRQQGIVIPPKLDFEAAGDLNAAYAIEQPLMELLKRHRLQALARSPLAKRIGTLRELSRLDAQNPIWQDDLREYERTRIQQIQQEAEEAVQRSDTTKLQTLVAEVRENSWSEPVPQSVRTYLENWTNRLRRRSARAELERLEPQLNQAFAQFDEDAGLRLRELWDACMQQVVLKPDDPLLDQAKPALEWTDGVRVARQEEDIYENAKRNLEHALDENAGLRELERLHHTAVTRRPLPEVLERRFQTRRESLELSAVRRRRLLISVVAVAVLLTGMVTTFALRRHMHNQEVAENAVVLGSLLSEGKLDEADEYLKKLSQDSPRVAASPKIGDFRARLHERQASERKRTEHFKTAIERAEQAGIEKPDNDALERASALARTPDEKLRVEELRGSIDAHRRRQQMDRDDKFANDAAGLAKRIEEIESKAELEPESTLKLLAVLEHDLTALLLQQSSISNSTFAVVPNLQARLAQLRSDCQRHKDESAAMPTITSASKTLPGYRAALERYVTRFAGTRRAQDFQRLLSEEFQYYEVLGEWQAFAHAWTEAFLHGDPPDAASLVKQAESLLRKHADFFWSHDLQDRIDFLKAIAGRNGLTGLADLRSLFSDPLISKLSMVQDTDKKRYYHTQPLNLSHDPVEIAYITAFDGATKKKKFRADDLKEQRVWHGEAPQSVVASQALKALQLLDNRPWELVFLGLCELIQQQPRIEPIVQILLLKEVLDIGCQGSLPMQRLCGKVVELLKNPPVDLAAVWVNPLDDSADRQRKLAKDFVEALPDFKKLKTDALAKRNELSRLPLTGIETVGWVALTNEGWRVLTSESLKQTGQLFVLARKNAGERIGAIEIGKVEEGAIHLNDMTGQLQGRLAFLAPRTLPGPSH